MRYPLLFKFRRDYTNENCATTIWISPYLITAFQNLNFESENSSFWDWFVDNNLAIIVVKGWYLSYLISLDLEIFNIGSRHVNF